ncbi:MAG TPA: glycosyltransferase family 2 protein [Lacipirellulaceae bacterium]|nr:glycosyltransferase family 2 protein [Lacipirellulaceae bacterium]
MNPSRFLTALPVYNEYSHVDPVLDEVVRYAQDVLVVDDGSSDGTRELLEARLDIRTIRHGSNRGYGAALKTAFDFAIDNCYDVLVTIDCDGQHTPQRICKFVEACENADIASGSRYLCPKEVARQAPAERRQINVQITRELNERLGLLLTDAFCGFKAYRVPALAKLSIKEPGYGMPIELWVQAAYHQMRIVEVSVPLIYLDENRSFGGSLDDGRRRLEYYHRVLDQAIADAVNADHSGMAVGVRDGAEGTPQADGAECNCC